MPAIIPAMKGRFGTTEYFVVLMKAKDVADKLKVAKDFEDNWNDPDGYPSLEERYQRDLNLNRVKKQIAPYFAENENRFSGALILAMANGERTQFESIKVDKTYPQMQTKTAESFGFLNLTDEEVFIPLDGQHRAKAFEFAIGGKDEKGAELHFNPSGALAKDDVTVMLIRYDSEVEKVSARRIFNVVNRYAKPTTKAQNLITDDDDYVAVITRHLVRSHGEGLINPRLINLANTVPDNSCFFTTLATLYEINKEILIARGHEEEDVKKGKPRNKADKKQWSKDVFDAWEELLNGIDLFRSSASDPSPDGDAHRQEVRAEFLLGKPIGQRPLVGAFLNLTKGDGGNMPHQAACDRLNKIDWKSENDHWVGILVGVGGKVLSGVSAIKLGTDFVSYMAGMPMESHAVEFLRGRIAVARGEDNYKLPTPIF